MNTPDLETVLRAAPGPQPPPGLRERLIAQVQLPAGHATSPVSIARQTPAGWLPRWWPALAPASVTLACAVVLTVQQMEIRDLKGTLQALSQAAAAAETVPSTPVIQDPQAAAAHSENGEQQEIARLKATASQLATEIAQLEQLRLDNGNLRAQLAAPPAGFLTPEETEALTSAKEKAQSINCMNNMKQLGLSVKVWALDNNDTYPPDVLDMTNEMSTPKILHCPADTAHPMAETFASYTAANCSYEYLAASGSDTEPTRVLFRCPIHGHIALCDGSVQASVAKDHPERLVQRDGKLYLDNAGIPRSSKATPRSNADSSPNPNLKP